jgi:adenylate cyclase
MSREQFAFRTKLGKSTVDKLLTGLFSDRTLAIVESHTGLALRAMLEQPPQSEAGKAARRRAEAARPAVDRGAALREHERRSRAGLLADGISDDLITELARLRWLLVIARNSSFAYKGKSVDVRQVSQQLGVRYVLEGSVRTAGQKIRIVCQLIDAESGKHIWAERYDRELSDIFAVQDDITERVVAAVEPHLYAEEGFRAAKPAARQHRRLGPDRARARIADQDHAGAERRGARPAPPRDRDRARLCARLRAARLGLLAERHVPVVRRLGGAAQPGGDACESRAGARSQRSLGPHGLGHDLSSAAQHERALEELRKALDLNPSFALGRMAYGWALLRRGFFDEAIAETGRALRMSPLDSFAGFYTSTHGLALLGAKRFAEALPFLREAVAAFAEYPGHYNTLISCCGHLGRLEEAREFLAVRNRVAAPLRVGIVRRSLGRYAHGATFVEGLVKAGVRE